MQLPVKLLKEGTDTSQGKRKNHVTWNSSVMKHVTRELFHI